MTEKQIKCEPHGWFDFAYGEAEPIPCPKCVYLKAESPTPAQRAAYVVYEDGGKDYYYEGYAREDSIEEQIELARSAALRERDAAHEAALQKARADALEAAAALAARQSAWKTYADLAAAIRALLEEAGK